MKKTIKSTFLLLTTSLFLLLTTSFSLAALETVDAGFDDKFEFSKNSIERNERITVYAYFDNNSEHNLKGTYAFYVDGKKIDQDNIKAAKKSRSAIWTTIRISERSELKVSLLSLQTDTNGVREGVYSNNKETKTAIEPGQAVSKFAKVQASISASSKDVVDVADQARLDLNSNIEKTIEEIEPEADNAEGLTFKKIWLWILKFFNIIASNFILSLIAFFIFAIYLFKYSKKGYQKVKK